jgi:hypothetical protein
VYKNVKQSLMDGCKIKVHVPFKLEAVKLACEFLFSTENKTCTFVDDGYDIIVDGYPTRNSLCGRASHMSLDAVDGYFLGYETRFLSVMTTDNYTYPKGDVIWLPATLQKIELAIRAGYSTINVFDINKNTLDFCLAVMENRVHDAIEMIHKFGANTSPISLSIDEKIAATQETAKFLTSSKATIRYHQLDVIVDDQDFDGLVDVSNIFTFPRNTWHYSQDFLNTRFSKFKHVIGWAPNFEFHQPNLI